MRFVRTGLIDTIVYCDYAAETSRGFLHIDEVFRKFESSGFGQYSDTVSSRHGAARFDLLHPHELEHLPAAALGFQYRSDFFPEAYRGYGGDAPSPMIGAYAEFRIRNSDTRPIAFYYLNTEAIQTYIHLWGAVGLAAHIVVVQNHGKGGLWTPLDGDCLLYAAAQRLPRFLWLGDIGSKPWPNYYEISCKVIDPHSMHKSKRSLYKCTRSNGQNPESPLNEWDGFTDTIQSQKYPQFQNFSLATR